MLQLGLIFFIKVAHDGLLISLLTAMNKQFQDKINKPAKIHALAVAKHDTINAFVSQALNNNNVVISESNKYYFHLWAFISLF